MSTRRRKKRRYYTPSHGRGTGSDTYIGRREPVRRACPEREQPVSRPSSSQSGGRTYCVMAMPPAGSAPSGAAAKAVVPPAAAVQRKEVTFPVRERLKSSLRVMTGLLLTAVIVSSPAWLTTEELLPVMKKLSAASASMQLPEEEGGGVIEGEVITPDPPQTTTTPTTTATEPTTSTTAAPAAEGMLPVAEKQIKGSGTKVGDIYVKNSTGYDPDFSALMAEKADCRIKLNAGYQVLVIHTHTTEGYAARTDGLYDPDYSPRTTDMSKSVAAVGEALTERLEAAGIRTLHLTEVHDYPKYNGSYDRALKTIKKYLEEYPSIEMVLDVHRDAVTYDDGTKLKPTAVINGKNAAQVMIISGCDAGGSLYFPEWQSNLSMALQIQRQAEKKYSGLMRPLNFAPYRYNMHMTPNSLLLEFGTDVNTLEEAVYSAELTGDAIAEVLLEYVVK